MARAFLDAAMWVSIIASRRLTATNTPHIANLSCKNNLDAHANDYYVYPKTCVNTYLSFNRPKLLTFGVTVSSAGALGSNIFAHAALSEGGDEREWQGSRANRITESAAASSHKPIGSWSDVGHSG